MVPTTSERASGSVTIRRGVRRLVRPAVEPVGRLGRALHRPAEPALRVQPVDLLGHHEQRRHRRGVVGLVLGGVVDRGREVERRRDPPAGRLDLRHPLQRGGRQQGDPQAAVGREALLRCEVVGVGLPYVDRQPAGAGGGVDEQQGVVVGTRHPAYVGHHPGGRLVVRPGVGVDAGLADRLRTGAGLGRDDGRLGEERRRAGRRRELLRELTEREVLAALADQSQHRGVPERGGAAVAEHDLVAVGQGEQLGEAAAQPAHLALHRRLAVRGAEQRGAGGGECLELGGADLGRPGAEASVGGQQVARNGQGGCVRHGGSLLGRVESGSA